MVTMSRSSFISTSKILAVLLLLLFGFVSFVAISYSSNNHTSLTPNSFQSSSKHTLDELIDNNPLQLSFKNTTFQWGVNSKHEAQNNGLHFISQTIGSGFCIFDFNNDHYLDLLVVQGAGNQRRYGRQAWWQSETRSQLFKNNGGVFFTDVTSESGIDFRGQGMGCTFGDIDDDGHTDLLITAIDRISLYKNNGDGTFEDRSEYSGLRQKGWHTGAKLGDLNNDGLPDLYVPNFVSYQEDQQTFESEFGFQRFEKNALDPLLYDSQANALYLNKGDFVFSEKSDLIETNNSNGRSLGAKWIDLNRDSFLDLVVVNFPPTPNEVYINQNGERLTVAGSQYDSIRSTGSKDLAVSYRYEQQPSYFLSGDALTDIAKIHVGVPTGSDKPNTSLSKTTALTSHKKNQSTNTALNNWGLAHLPLTGIAGDLLFVANGAMTKDPDNKFQTTRQTNSIHLISNTGNWNIQPAQADTYSSRAVAVADLNLDGKLEIIVSNNNSRLEILEAAFQKFDAKTNRQEKPAESWFGIAWKNIEKINWRLATLEVTTDTGTVYYPLSTENGYLSDISPTHYFAVKDDSIKNIRIAGIADPIDVGVPELSRYSTFDLDSKALSTLTTSKENWSKQFISTLAADTKKLQPNEKQHLFEIYGLYGNRLVDKRIAIFNQLDEAQQINIIQNLDLDKTSDLALLYAIDLNKTAAASSIADRIIRSESDDNFPILKRIYQQSDTQTKCKIANGFEKLFDEEEAMIISKHELVKPLLITLAEPDHHSRLCAINALAKSDTQKVALALIQLLSHENNSDQITTDTVYAAINAIGEIRDSIAIPFLQRTLLEYDDIASTPKVTQASRPLSPIAAAYIALQKFNDPKADKLLAEKITRLTNDDPDNGITLIHNIVKHPDFKVATNHYQKRHLLDTLLAHYDQYSGLISIPAKQKLTASLLRLAPNSWSLDNITQFNDDTPLSDEVFSMAMTKNKTARLAQALIENTNAIADISFGKLVNLYEQHTDLHSVDFNLLFDHPRALNGQAMKSIIEKGNHRFITALMHFLLKQKTPQDHAIQDISDLCDANESGISWSIVNESFVRHRLKDIESCLFHQNAKDDLASTDKRFLLISSYYLQNLYNISSYSLHDTDDTDGMKRNQRKLAALLASRKLCLQYCKLSEFIEDKPPQTPSKLVSERLTETLSAIDKHNLEAEKRDTLLSLKTSSALTLEQQLLLEKLSLRLNPPRDKVQ